MKKSILLASLLAAVALTACSKKEETATGTPGEAMTIKIGQVSPLTGPQAHLGKDNDNGARLAIDENNASGITLGSKKVKFILVSEDDVADPRTATVVAQKLVDQRVAGVGQVRGHGGAHDAQADEADFLLSCHERFLVMSVNSFSARTPAEPALPGRRECPLQGGWRPHEVGKPGGVLMVSSPGLRPCWRAACIRSRSSRCSPGCRCA